MFNRNTVKRLTQELEKEEESNFQILHDVKMLVYDLKEKLNPPPAPVYTADAVALVRSLEMYRRNGKHEQIYEIPAYVFEKIIEEAEKNEYAKNA